MMILSTRDRRALLIGSIVLGGSFALTRGIPAWLTLLAESADSASRETRALADARALIVAAPALRDSLTARRTRYLAMAPSVIASATPDEAVARLSGIVSESASNAGVVLSSLSLIADTTSVNGFGRPSVRGEARGDVSGLTQFLLLIEIGPPMLRVSHLTVTQPDPVGTGRAEELRIAFVIEGMSLTASAQTSAKGSE